MSTELNESFLGRCDLCGKPIDLRDAGDQLVIQEFGLPNHIKEEYGLTDQDAADGVADTLESEHIYQHAYDGMLADVIRENLGYKVHERCLDKTAFDQLETSGASRKWLT